MKRVNKVLMVQEMSINSLNEKVNEILEKFPDRETDVGDITMHTVKNFNIYTYYVTTIKIGRLL